MDMIIILTGILIGLLLIIREVYQYYMNRFQVIFVINPITHNSGRLFVTFNRFKLPFTSRYKIVYVPSIGKHKLIKLKLGHWEFVRSV